ncbi:hypothetical protein [Nonomuraea recticatena]|uniref:hypothetical protein n=1 Tax=Nonomuraea recticatena TaxID=46178 RepID=UPI0036167958
MSRAAGWISPVVIHEGRVAGVWEGKDGQIALELFEQLPEEPLRRAVERMRRVLTGEG